MLKNNNFDLIRLALASTVFLVHASGLSQQKELAVITQFLNSEVAVNSFFVISGFLVSMSFQNSLTTKEYMVKRIRRIYPAYCLVVLVSVLAASLLTTLPLGEYFSFKTLKYLAANLSFLNLIQPTLPGVFENNTLSAVNGALWTIRFEMLFYTFIPLLCFLMKRFNKHAVYATLFFLLAVCILCFQVINIPVSSEPLRLLMKITPEILLYFLCGSFLFCCYNIYDRLPFITGAVIIFGYLFVRMTGLSFFIPFFLSGMVIFFACHFKYLGNWGRYGDFSYGIYIWHFPVLQTFISFGFFERNPYSALFYSTLVVGLFSFISWHGVEKHFLKRTSHYLSTSESLSEVPENLEVAEACNQH